MMKSRDFRLDIPALGEVQGESGFVEDQSANIF
jgi:hypothetical protein